VTLTVCFGIAVSIAMSIIVYGWERERIRLDFETRAMHLAVPIERSVQESIEGLRAISSFLEASGTIGRRQFEAFAKREVAEHPSIQALEWVPRVRDSERAAYEAAARREGSPDFQITERSSQGQMIRRARRAEYFPVSYVEPFKGNEIALGFDLASNPARLEALERARDTGALAATSRIVLVQETGEQFGFLIFMPIYRPGSSNETVEKRRRNLLGFALGVFRIKELVEASLKGLDVMGIDISISDEAAPASSQRLLFHHAQSGRPLGVQIAGADGAEALAGLRWSTVFDVGARQWSVLFVSSPEYLAARRSWQPWGVLAACLLLTTSLAAYLRMSIGRTHLLGQAKESLENEFSARAQAEERLLGRTQQLEALRAVSAEITRELDLGTLLGLIIRRAVELVGATSGQIHLWDETTQTLIPCAWPGLGEWMAGVRFRLGEAFTGTVAQRRQGMIIDDYRSWPGADRRFLERTGINAIAGEPLLYRDHLVGVIVVHHEGAGRAFTDQDREILSLFAAQAAIAIENARLFHQEQERRGQLEAIRTVTVEITRELDLPSLLGVITERATELLGADLGAIALWEEEAQVLVSRAWHGYESWLGEVRYKLGEGLTGTVAQRREAVIVNDYPASPFAHPLFVERMHIKAAVGQPLLYRDRLLGVIHLANTGDHPPFTEREATLLSLFATQAAIAIQNAQLYADLERRLGEMEALRRIDNASTARLELPEVLTAVVTGARQFLGSDFAQVALWDEASQRLRFGAALGPDAERIRSQAFDPVRGINGMVAETRQPMVLDNYQSWPYAIPECPDVVATITVPILYGGRLLGVLYSHTTQPGRRFTADDLRRLQMLASQAAIVIENARLHDATVQQLAELKALHDMGRAIASGMNLDEQLEILIERLGRAAGAQRVLVGLVDSVDATRFRLCLARDASRADPWLRHLNLSPDRYPEIQEAVQKGRPLVIPDVQTEPLLAAARESLACVGLRSLVVIPLVVRDRTIGAVSLGYLGQVRVVTDEEVNRFQSFTAQGAIAIQQARLYDELQRSATLLEAKVEERTKELQVANEKLQEATRQAEEASHHKSEFLANMSHEIRTPMNAIIGFSDLLREQGVGPLNEKQLRYLSHIRNGGKHLLQLINDILDLSKVEAGKFVLTPEPLPVAETLEDILVIVRGLANTKQQTVRADIAADLPPLAADPVRLKQILFNLLSNAVKFTPEHGTITLTARQVTEDRRPETDAVPRSPSPVPCLEIRVTDTGAGIKAEDLPRLFQEFIQLETTQSQKHEGSGLGLALTRRLVEMHDGRIWAESDGEGRGSTFAILLPFVGPQDVNGEG
jgi:GAF domain-containing protein/CHASE1-domain containing sensor protein